MRNITLYLGEILLGTVTEMFNNTYTITVNSQSVVACFLEGAVAENEFEAVESIKRQIPPACREFINTIIEG
jgi:hypothetical protein